MQDRKITKPRGMNLSIKAGPKVGAAKPIVSDASILSKGYTKLPAATGTGSPQAHPLNKLHGPRHPINRRKAKDS